MHRICCVLVLSSFALPNIAQILYKTRKCLFSIRTFQKNVSLLKRVSISYYYQSWIKNMLKCSCQSFLKYRTEHEESVYSRRVSVTLCKRIFSRNTCRCIGDIKSHLLKYISVVNRLHLWIVVSFFFCGVRCLEINTAAERRSLFEKMWRVMMNLIWFLHPRKKFLVVDQEKLIPLKRSPWQITPTCHQPDQIPLQEPRRTWRS